jgi:hypothetical protein
MFAVVLNRQKEDEKMLSSRNPAVRIVATAITLLTKLLSFLYLQLRMIQCDEITTNSILRKM